MKFFESLKSLLDVELVKSPKMIDFPKSSSPFGGGRNFWQWFFKALKCYRNSNQEGIWWEFPLCGMKSIEVFQFVNLQPVKIPCQKFFDPIEIAGVLAEMKIFGIWRHDYWVSAGNQGRLNKKSLGWIIDSDLILKVVPELLALRFLGDDRTTGFLKRATKKNDYRT